MDGHVFCNEGGLVDWLAGRPVADGVVLAWRSACRVAPLAVWDEDPAELPLVLRDLIAAGAFLALRTGAKGRPDRRAGAYAARVMERARRGSAAVPDAAAAQRHAATAAGNAAAHSAAGAAIATGLAAWSDPVGEVAHAVQESARAAALVSFRWFPTPMAELENRARTSRVLALHLSRLPPGAEGEAHRAAAALWAEAATDAEAIGAGQDVLRRPLWSMPVPAAVTLAETDLAARWSGTQDNRAFGARSWRAVRSGRPFSARRLLREVLDA